MRRILEKTRDSDWAADWAANPGKTFFSVQRLSRYMAIHLEN